MGRRAAEAAKPAPELRPEPRLRTVVLLFALGVFLIYCGLSPNAVAGMGYTAEDMRTGAQILSGEAVEMPRNGILPVLLDLPFLAVGRQFARPDWGQDMMLAFEPCLLSALIATLILLWTWSATGEPGYSLGVALAAAFCSMLWPYAYIGLETKQTLFLLTSAYLAISYTRPATWGAVIAFSISTGFAISSKSTGAFVIPAAAYLTWLFTRRLRSDDKIGGLSPRGSTGIQMMLCLAVPAILFLINAYTRSLFWAKWGGSFGFIKVWIVTQWLMPVLNLFAFLGSPNKGLLIFSPLCLFGLIAIPRGWRERHPLAIWTILTLAGLAGGFSLLRNWADETWGPRYLHSAIPALILLGAIHGRKLAVPKFVVAGVLALGLVTATLGIVFPFSALPAAAIQTGQNALEAYQGDINVNHLLFNARLLDVWFRPDQTATYGTGRTWFYEPPKGYVAPAPVDLHLFANAQPFLMRHLHNPKTGPIGRVWFFDLACLVVGLGLVGASIRAARRRTAA